MDRFVELKRLARETSLVNELAIRRDNWRELSEFFKDWDIYELAALMQALKIKYNPLLDDVCKEMEGF